MWKLALGKGPAGIATTNPNVLMSMKTIHVVPSSEGGWDVKRGGAQRASAHYDTKAPATDRARELSRSRNSELFIHNRDGRIGSRDSHGGDSPKRRG